MNGGVPLGSLDMTRVLLRFQMACRVAGVCILLAAVALQRATSASADATDAARLVSSAANAPPAARRLCKSSANAVRPIPDRLIIIGRTGRFFGMRGRWRPGAGWGGGMNEAGEGGMRRAAAGRACFGCYTRSHLGEEGELGGENAGLTCCRNVGKKRQW